MFKGIKLKNCITAVLGSALLAFGLYNVHSFARVTEGGVLGLTLLLDYWFGISPAVSSFVMNAVCYIIAAKMMGRDFVVYSAVSALSFSVAYGICEQFPPIYPQIGEYPLAAAVLGAVFVGVGVGLAVRAGGAPGGDDALAMALSGKLKIGIQWVYLIGDITVMALALTYIPLQKIWYSFLTVIISGQLVGFVQNAKFPSKIEQKNEKFPEK